MNRHLDQPVVVGYDGTDRSLAALRYGIEEAVRRATSLEVVHVSPGLAPGYVDVPDLEAEVRATARRAVGAAEAELGRLSPGLAANVCEATGSVADQIVRHSDGAQLVVLGRETKSALEKAVTGAIAGAVARRAPAPVVVVPQGWPGITAERQRIVVGLRDAGHVDGLLQEAFARAAAAEAELHVIHAWSLPDPYVDSVESRTDPARWVRAGRLMVEAAVGEWRADCPDVPVTIEIVHADPAHALVQASASASLSPAK